MDGELATWALPRLQRLLPIDDESLREILSYTLTLPKEAGAEHLKNILGENSQSLEFISGFNARRKDSTTSTSSGIQTQNQPDYGVPRKKKTTKAKAPLHSAGAVRQPEGYGNTTGGYRKSTAADTSLANSLTLTPQPAALQVPTTSTTVQTRPSPAPSPKPTPPSAAGPLISDLPNIRTKTSKPRPNHSNPPSNHPSGTSTPSRNHTSHNTTTATTSSIADLTTAISALELLTNPTLTTSLHPRKCPCNASIHPLFTPAPNCLNCGKIICALEGAQPCSSCGSAILSPSQINEMIAALKQERGAERQANHNAGIAAAHSGRGTPLLGVSPSITPGITPEHSGDEGTSAATQARRHRDKLLGFQRENAQRTRVHDEAADFDVGGSGKGTMWMSPVQRAAALKRQQGYLRELEEAGRPEWERKRTVMSMSVRGGKVVRTYEKVPVEAAVVGVDEGDGDGDVEGEGAGGHDGGDGGKKGFSDNPLLNGGGLVRPVWKPKDGKGKEMDLEGDRKRKSVWRRVQDDNEDNEKWILDGGLRGYGVETRVMEDGSQQECG